MMILVLLALISNSQWPDSVPALNLQFDESQWEYACENYWEDIYVPAQLTYDGYLFPCSFRIRGGTSRSYPKKSIKVELVSGFLIFGQDEINLNAEYLDWTRLRECLSYLYYNSTSQTVPEVHLVELVFNGETQGGYLSVEDIDSDFLLNTSLPDEAVIYKCADRYTTLDRVDELEPYDKKNHEDQPWDDFVLLMYWLKLCPDSIFRSQLQDRFYYDDLLSCVATNVLLGHGSTYYHNYHLLLDETGAVRRWRYITWDMDRTWWKYGPEVPYHRNSCNDGNRRNVLIWRMWCNDIIRQDLFEEIARQQPGFLEFVQGNTIDSLAALIAPLVEADPFREYTMAEFWGEVDILDDWPAARYANVLEQIELHPLPFSVAEPEEQGGDIDVSWQSAGDQCSWRLTISSDSLFSNPDEVVYEAFPSNTFHVVPEMYTGTDLWLQVFATRNGTEQRSSNGPVIAHGITHHAISGEIVINEINYNSSPAINSGDWFELISIDEEPISLTGWSVRDNSHTNLTTLDELVISPGQCMVFSSDSMNFVYVFSTAPSQCLTFHLSGNGDQLRLYDPVGDTMDSLQYLPMDPWPWQADGYGSTLMLLDPTMPNQYPGSWAAGPPGGTPFSPDVFQQSALMLNELMASNDTTIADNYGEYDDWIEITNPGPDDINLSDYHMTDDVTEPFKFTFPDSVIHPDEFFIVWADNAPEQGSMHAGFRLSSAGQSIYLLNSLLSVDKVTFPELDADVSYGRLNSSLGNAGRKGSEWCILPYSTPGWSNALPRLDTNYLHVSSPFPNPVISGSAALDISVNTGHTEVTVYDITGRLVDVIFDDSLEEGEHRIYWDTLQSNGNSAPAGVYLLTVRHSGGLFESRKLVILNR